MTEKPPPESQSDKTEENGNTPMRRFENLVRGLLRVEPKQVKDEQVRYDEENNDGRKRPKLRTN